MKVIIARWEDNGYHDSDFEAAIWDSETEEMTTFLEGSTRFGGGTRVEKALGAVKLYDCPEEVRDRFRAWACREAAKLCHDAEKRRIMNPEPGDIIKGDHLVTTRIVRPRKKPAIPIGTKGRVFWSGSYGHNRPNRNNTRVGIKTEGGEAHFLALDACRLDKPVEPVEPIERRMLDSYDQGQFNVAPLTTARAWLSESYLYEPRKAKAV